MASRPTKPPLPPPAERKLSRLKLLWRFARAYPLQLVAALVALGVAAVTTLAIPQGLKMVVDNGFQRGSDPAAIAPFFVAFLGLVGLLGAATAVVEALVKRGVKSERLKSQGFGPDRPIASNDTDAGQAKNRRTEFYVEQ